MGVPNLKDKNVATFTSWRFRSLVEVCYKPRLGMPGVKDRDREEVITRTCSAAVLTSLHPRTAVTINIQEMQDGGCLVATSINAACLALLDASVPLSFLLAAVTVAVTKDGELLVDPTLKQARNSSAEAMFVFSSREEGAVSSVIDGKLGHDQLQQALTAARLASKAIFEFYRETIRRKFSKEI